MSDEPERRARKQIDQLLEAAGWHVQHYKNLNLSESLGVAVREFPMKSGFADYLLFIDKKAAGVVEAKPEGTTLSGVAEQSRTYASEIPEKIPKFSVPLPFLYESTGVETFFRDQRDPDARSRRVFAFHKPETFERWIAEPETLRARLKTLPPLIEQGLRDCQVQAIMNLERSLLEDRPRALIQMASGSGKTFTAVTTSYRLVKFSKTKRILFLVDRNTLGIQTKREYEQFVTPDDGRKFTDLYNIQHLTTNAVDSVSRVCITTIQRLYSMLKGEGEFDPANEEGSLFESGLEQPAEPVEVKYNHLIPIETFDFIITDECHRSIYNLWRQVLEYFDAFIIGLTATPSKQTLGFFNQNLVMEYSQEQAIVGRVNVPYEVYRIKTEITEKGSRVDAGYYVDKRDRLTRRLRWEQLDQDLVYPHQELDRSVVAKDQIRTIIKIFKEKLFTEIFPGRTEVPKTLIFAKDDSHAEDIVGIVKEEFGKGNEFCKKITYRTYGEKPEDLIASFRNSYNPRIAVNVDMISTGTDIRPLECLLFMRDVKSRTFFEQMKGRGARTISDTDFNAVTPDALHKTHYVIVDAVGVCEHDKTDSRPLERKRSVPFDKLLTSVALGARDVDSVTSLAGRLVILSRELTDTDREEIAQTSGGREVEQLVESLLFAVDPDKIEQKAIVMFSTQTPSPQQLKQAQLELLEFACRPFDRAELRNLLIEIRRRSEQVIDSISQDRAILVGFGREAKDRAKAIVSNLTLFIQDHKNELIALQIIYGQPFSKRKLTFEAIKGLAESIKKPPYSTNTELLWQSFENLERSKVHGAGPQRLLTDIISLIRYAVGASEVLEPFSETVKRRFQEWLSEQEMSGRKFTPGQREWLLMIRDHIATSLWVEIQDLELPPFHEKGGPLKFWDTFGSQADRVLEDLNNTLIIGTART